MKKKWFNKSIAALLMEAMVVSMFAGIKVGATRVYAAESSLPTTAYWTDVEGLKDFKLTTSASIGRIRFGLNQGERGIWAICGVDGTDELALISTSPFDYEAYGSSNIYSDSLFVTDIKKYTGDNNNTSKYLGTDYFSSAELDKMKEVKVTTYNSDDVTSKLYLPNAYNQGSAGQSTIYTGMNNSIAIDANVLANIGLINTFWLRSPVDDSVSSVLAADPYKDLEEAYVNSVDVSNNDISLVPALNLNLSDVLFASAAQEASPEYSGYIADDDFGVNTYTIRYKSNGDETATISTDGSYVEVMDAKDKYLMVQNSSGVYAILIDSDRKTVSANEIQIGSENTDNLNNCKVWVESTADRITTAKLAKKPIESETVTDITDPSVGGTFDTAGSSDATVVSTTSPDVGNDTLAQASEYHIVVSDKSMNVTPTKNTYTYSPQTGDESRIVLLGVLVILSVLGICGLTYVEKRRKKETK